MLQPGFVQRLTSPLAACIPLSSRDQTPYLGTELWFTMAEGHTKHLDIARPLRDSNQISFVYESDNSVPDLRILVRWVQTDKPIKSIPGISVDSRIKLRGAP